MRDSWPRIDVGRKKRKKLSDPSLPAHLVQSSDDMPPATSRHLKLIIVLSESHAQETPGAGADDLEFSRFPPRAPES